MSDQGSHYVCECGRHSENEGRCPCGRWLPNPLTQGRWTIYVCECGGAIGGYDASPWTCGLCGPAKETEVVPASLLSESQAEVERLKKLLEDTAAAVMMAGARRDELAESQARERQLAAALKRADEKLAHIVHRIRAVQVETIGEALSSVSRPEGQ